MLITFYIMISAKKLILSIETTLRTLPFTKISLKSSGMSISEKIRILRLNALNKSFNSL